MIDLKKQTEFYRNASFKLNKYTWGIKVIRIEEDNKWYSLLGRNGNFNVLHNKFFFRYMIYKTTIGLFSMIKSTMSFWLKYKK